MKTTISKCKNKLNAVVTKDKIIPNQVSKCKMTLKDKFLKYNGENLSKEFEWDSPKGKELW